MKTGSHAVVQFRSDGLGLSPAEYARLLAEIAETRGIDVDDYSRGGVVAELEERMAALLGKESGGVPADRDLGQPSRRAAAGRQGAAGGCWCSRKAICGTTRATARRSSAG